MEESGCDMHWTNTQMNASMSQGSIREALKKSELIVSAYRIIVRPIRWLRRKYLLWIHPNGDYMDCTGERVYCDFNDPNYYWYDGDSDSLAFEKELVVTLMQQSEGNLFVDIGAHYGFFSSCMARRAGTEDMVLSIEPDAEVFKCLEKTMEPLEEEEGGESLLLNCALGSENKTITAYKSDSLACLHTYHKDDRAYFSTKVNVRTLDSIVNELAKGRRVAMIKLDVDGSEPQVLAGSKHIVAEHKPIFYIEFAPWCLEGAGEDPKKFYIELHKLFDYVYWHSYQLGKLEQVWPDDYDRIREITGECVTNLVLSSKRVM